MRPSDLNTRIFLDGGDPGQTRQVLSTMGFLDGQTTNPSLVANNPEAKKRLAAGQKFGSDELLGFYKDIIQELSSLLPAGSVSIEVYADEHTTAEQMFAQGKQMNTWIPNAHIKYPTTQAGLGAAERSVQEGMRVNMTLVFTQSQAAAVYAATRGAKKGQVFLSPFVGRLDDKGLDGMQLIANILRMYSAGDGHVEVLTASVRQMDHMMEAFRLGSHIITAPGKLLLEWHAAGQPLPQAGFVPAGAAALGPIAYEELRLDRAWTDYDIHYPLTDSGQTKFAADWNALLA